jgi:hypothetical protein
MRRLVLILMLAGQALAQSQISRIILLICSGSSPPDGFRAQVRPVRSRANLEALDVRRRRGGRWRVRKFDLEAIHGDRQNTGLSCAMLRRRRESSIGKIRYMLLQSNTSNA